MNFYFYKSTFHCFFFSFSFNPNKKKIICYSCFSFLGAKHTMRLVLLKLTLEMRGGKSTGESIDVIPWVILDLDPQSKTKIHIPHSNKPPFRPYPCPKQQAILFLTVTINSEIRISIELRRPTLRYYLLSGWLLSLASKFSSSPTLIRICWFAFESILNYLVARCQMHVLTFWSNIQFLYPFFLCLYLLFSCTYCVCMLVSALGNAASVLILCRRWLHWRNPWPFALDVVHLLWSD